MNDYYGVRRSNYLSHHGILGMKWGVRRFQNKNGSLTSAGKKRYAGKSRKRGLKLTDRQKRAIKIGAAVAITGLAIYGGYKLHNIANESIYKNISDNFDAKPEIGNGFHARYLKTALSEDEKLALVNPHYSRYNQNYYMNCGNCSIAYELLNRGYDSTAKPNAAGMSIPEMASYFEGAHSGTFTEVGPLDVKYSSFGEIRKSINNGLSSSDIFTVDRGEKVKSQLEKRISSSYPDGSRGTMLFTMLEGSHWISWKKENGTVRFINPQDPSIDLVKDCFSKYAYRQNNNLASTTAIRLDDLKINMDLISNAIEDSGSKEVQSLVFPDVRTVKGKNFTTKIL